MSSTLRFDLVAEDATTRARAGVLHTLHSEVQTPVFMPVGTRGVVRTQSATALRQLNPSMILSNTYHLMLRPGAELLGAAGGLHKWMRWPRGILTDSGGFQVFSLSKNSAVTEEGVVFRPQADAPMIKVTPESSIGMQRVIGSDIMMVLDQCVEGTSSHDVARAAMELTHRWAKRSWLAKEDSPQALFAIVQGACHPDLRRESVQALTSMGGFDGFAIGGLAVGESKPDREEITSLTTSLLPRERPRYLMGVGMPIDLLEAVARGVDMFDCILPTALAQYGVTFTSQGKINMRRVVYRTDTRPLDPNCPCEACTEYSRSYLHHLLKAQEPVAWQLLANHNLRFYLELMKSMRAEIVAGTFGSFYARMREELVAGDEEHPKGPSPRTRTVRPTTRGNFALHRAPAGFWQIAHTPSGEIMHSVNNPDDEARRLYVEQSHLIEDSLLGRRGQPLVIWDVGLGAGHNAMAVIRAWQAAESSDALELVSFEHDLDAFRLAVAYPSRFPHLRHKGPGVVLEHGEYLGKHVTWRLTSGNFVDHVAIAPRPDVVLYDPFSKKVDAGMWSETVLAATFDRMQVGAELFTYSHSTAVRTNLLAAGFFLAAGVATGPKDQTTIALKEPTEAARTHHTLLDATWFARWERSSAGGAQDEVLLTEQQRQRLQAVRNHPQFVAR